ncbi:hypothetical protein, partial [Zavarzinella formosa]|uniref:hypothetical protein n=1 Tax=Zavarzinella formosa TaxID=360055 RepID=UPI000594C0BB
FDLCLLVVASVSSFGIGFLVGWQICCEVNSRKIEQLKNELKKTKKALGTICKESMANKEAAIALERQKDLYL